MTIEEAACAVIKAARKWRNTDYHSPEEDRAALRLRYAIDDYEDLLEEQAANLTGDTITKADVYRLINDPTIDVQDRMTALVALHGDSVTGVFGQQNARARARCAEIINAQRVNALREGTP